MIYIWSDACTVAKCIKAHAARIECVEATQGMLLSGGKDKRICIITAGGGNWQLKKFVSLPSSYPVSIDIFNGNLLVGLRNGSILEYEEALTAENPAEKCLMESHFEGEVWGLELVPGQS